MASVGLLSVEEERAAGEGEEVGVVHAQEEEGAMEERIG
jgi:hypothetical protein